MKYKVIVITLFLIMIAGCTNNAETPPTQNGATQPDNPLLEPIQKECTIDADCVPAQCCHATACVPTYDAPACDGIFCTEECRAGTIDCGGGCFCDVAEGKCKARYVDFTE